MEGTELVTEIAIDPGSARVYEHGWQSWSPSTTYRAGQRPFRPDSERQRIASYRPEEAAEIDAFQGEGLLAVQPGANEPVLIVAAADGRATIPSIRAEVRGGRAEVRGGRAEVRAGRAEVRAGRLAVSANGPVETAVDDGPGGIDGALARWADRFATRMGVPGIRRAPVGWCSWYQYFTAVTQGDIIENLRAMDRLALPIEVVQIDDGYQAGIGDWLSLSDRFASLRELVGQIRSAGRRAGIWVAPFLAGGRSRLAAQHPDWLVGPSGHPVDAGHNWDQDLYAVDTTHPAARAYLAEVFGTFHAWGVDYFKIDFVYGGALPGRRYDDVPAVAAYRSGLRLIRDSIGDSYLLGCGAPILPSVGLVDAMRVSPDTAPTAEPPDGDMSRPSSRAAMVTGAGRAFQQGRFWVNDPDCLIVRPAVEHREAWAEHVARFGGLRASSDRLNDLDEWGLETTRRLLAESPVAPFVASA
ncbi:MAG: glycoside hydrolase family 36 protein [Chloroflexota bacterium]